MKINDRFEAAEIVIPEVVIAERRVVRLFIDGQQIIDINGDPVDYESVEEARYVAEHWDDYRCPTWQELRSMSDDEVMGRAVAALRLELGRPAP